ncbi:MAG: adenosylcobinamide-phosphate synthase CbiB [Desulfobulbaceae bacterium]|jgi:adenosylcobinamide-phosphate synthase|nr:adenosylcobinamide-phosphate synthase CbiB [Desulfobulbaceae bacterium]
MLFTLQIIAALLLDFLFGDPPWLPHPARAVGLLCAWLEGRSRALCASPFFAGMLTVTVAIFSVIACIVGLLLLASLWRPWLAEVLALYFVYSGIAAKDLARHAWAVHRALIRGDLDLARRNVAMVVGRDTESLDETGVCRACVESVAENTADGVTAPIFFALAASLIPSPFSLPLSPLAMAALGIWLYKTINTMDSMFGYKNERYQDFGRAPARLDDAANFLPARLTGPTLVAAAFCLRLDGKESFAMLRRDRLAHSSPNSGHAEAAVAGALGLRLGGSSVYGGRIVEKPALGDATREISRDDIPKTIRLMFVATLLFTATLLALLPLIKALWAIATL